MAETKGHRASKKFCFLLGKTAAERAVMLETTYKDAAMSKTQGCEWLSHFRNGQFSLEDQRRSGRPSTSRTSEHITKIHELIFEDRHRIIGELVDMTGMTSSSSQRILLIEFFLSKTRMIKNSYDCMHVMD
ncbi:uncharacterized protein LOC128248678 [Octopus bimaculoides]|uniref:uncharacterized protein LOC128248678 n=1 Tax=Octopus bimaculoides TaxID=37653 RepID=UPI0022E5A9DA|nr:uncharacterized protein LOC128248678 [Octopus bimaculoides]